MIKKYLGIFILSSASSIGACSEIRSIDSLELARHDLALADRSTLVIFDIDKTLTYEVNAFRQTWFRETAQGRLFWNLVQQHYRSKANPDEFKALVESKRMKTFVADQPVESVTTSVIKMLQQKGVKVIALTACKTGKLGHIDCMEEWRFEKLCDSGIDFSGCFHEQKIILELMSDREGKHPIYYKGILLSEEDSIEKGQALGAFLERMQFKPSKVIFFDDRLSNVQSVQAEMMRRSIPFLGFEYKAVEKLPQRFNPAIVAFQLDHFQQYDEFITDEAAANLLQQNSL